VQDPGCWKLRQEPELWRKRWQGDAKQLTYGEGLQTTCLVWLT